MRITRFECVSVALFIGYWKCMHRIIFSFVVCLAVPCFSTLPHKGTIFRKIYRTQLVCFDSLCSSCLYHFLFSEEFNGVLA